MGGGEQAAVKDPGLGLALGAGGGDQLQGAGAGVDRRSGGDLPGFGQGLDPVPLVRLVWVLWLAAPDSVLPGGGLMNTCPETGSTSAVLPSTGGGGWR